MAKQGVQDNNFPALARRFGIEAFNDLSAFPFVLNRKQLLPYTFVRRKRVLPVDEENGVLIVAISHPYDLEAIEEVRSLTNKEVKEIFCPIEKLEEAIEKCYHQDDEEASSYIEGLKQESDPHGQENSVEAYDLLEKQDHSPVVRLLNMIMIQAIQQGASDIHFEPVDTGLTIRYRIDGVLQFRHSPPIEMQKQLMTRIKVMAKMDIAEHRLPQDGRIKLRMGGRHIDFRASTVPVSNGERIVLRILDKSNVILGLDKLGMSSAFIKKMRGYLQHNQGIILVTGPTGSGKTTTLYGAIAERSHEEINIMTIEDPVEYKLPKISQIGVNPKISLTFAKGLRHILRQDPDIIMVGEIRDKETAEIAIQSSLTGHLVLSTLHTNDAPSTLTRLVDMGIEPYLLSSSVLAVVAQRLVRLICDQCQSAYEPTDEELRELGIDRKKLRKGVLNKGMGCESCYGSGYRGRCGIYELMPMSREVKEQLLTSADSTAIQKVATANGMLSLRDEALRLALLGKTSTAEVLRVTKQLEV